MNIPMFTLPKQMREDYVVRRKADFETLSQTLANDSVEEFKRIGHQLAGNAESYGFPDLGQIGVKMESLNSTTLKTQGPDLVAAFKKWMDTVVVTDDQ